MSTLFEYITALRTSRHTSGHELEELDEFLNRYAAEGWRFVQMLYQDLERGHQLLIFEREKNNEQGGSA